MIIIRHRRNTVAELEATEHGYGIEVDIRSFGDALVTHHEPFVKGPLFDDWLQSFHHKTLILNVKEEGLEDRVLDLMRKHGITDFFFLDQSFPFSQNHKCDFTHITDAVHCPFQNNRCSFLCFQQIF